MNYPYCSLEHQKSLDGIRGLAVLLVVFFHCPLVFFRFDFGWAGVNLFFILSGFLITRILLSSKQASFSIYARSFYMRRVLRIFPLYFGYLLLIFLVILCLNTQQPLLLQSQRDFNLNYPYLLSYTYNFQAVFNFAAQRSYESSYFFGHLWSLSVEEQFYLFFPLVIYFVRPNILRPLFISVILLTPLLRWLFVDLSVSQIDDRFFIGTVLYNATPFQLDALLMGGVLAMSDPAKLMKYWRLVCIFLLLVSAAAAWWIFHVLSAYQYPLPKGSLGFDAPVYHVLFSTPNFMINNRYLYTIPLLNGLFSLLLLLAIHQKTVRFLMQRNWLAFIGKISYGIYILHLAFSCLFQLALEQIWKNEAVPFWPSLLFLVVYLALLLLGAYVSFRFFESRFLRLKAHFSIPLK